MEKVTDTGSNRFRKPERLRLRTLVEGLFAEGSTLYEYPLRLTWRAMDAATLSDLFRHGVPDGIGEVQVLFTVPKRKRRHAVDRVLMRRRMREAYRLNKQMLYEATLEMPELRTLSLAIVYMHGDNMDYADIERKMRKLFGKLIVKLRKGNND